MNQFINKELLYVEIHEYLEASELKGPSVSIFGSARYPKNHKYIQQAEKLASMLAQSGINIITGGGPGIMEAANKGASQSGGISCGFRIILPFEEYTNQYIDNGFHFNFDHFCTRKMAFIQHSNAFVIFPGGYGTLDELFECLVNIQNQKTKSVPIYLIGNEFWKGIIDWISDTLIQEGVISPQDAQIFTLMDDINEIHKSIIEKITLINK